MTVRARPDHASLVPWLSGQFIWHVGLVLVALILGLLSAVMPLTQLVLIAGMIGLVTATLAEPLIGIGAALLLGPLRAWLEIRSPGIIPHVGQLVLVMTIVAWLARGMVRRSLRVALPPRLGFLTAFLVAGLVSLWNPVDVWDGSLELVKWVQVALVAVVVYSRVEALGGHVGARLAFWLLVGSAAFQAIIGLWQFGLGGSGVEEFAINDRLYRAYGTFQQPNPYAGFLGLVGAVLVGAAASALLQLCRGTRSWEAVGRLLRYALPAMLMVAGLGASWSRGGWMGFAMALFVIGLLLPERRVWGLAMVGAGTVLVVGLLVTGRLPSTVVDRLTGFLAYVRFDDVRGVGITDANFSVVERMAHWQAALGMWRTRFWLGVGLGGYEAAYPVHRLINWPLPLGHAHNFYLNLLGEVGIAGLLSYVVWLGATVLGLLQAVDRQQGWRRGLALGLMGAWTHLAVHSLVDNLYVNNVHLHVGVLVALSGWVIAERPSRRSS